MSKNYTPLKSGSESGNLEPKAADGGSLEINGLHASGGVTPRQMPAPYPRRQPWLRGVLVPLAVAAAFGTTAFVVSSYFVTPWYSSQATLFFPAVGNQGASGLFNSLLGGGSSDSTGSVSVLGGIYTVPLVGSGPGTAMMVLASGQAQAQVANKLHLAQRWHVTPDKVGPRLAKNVTYGINKDGLLAIAANDTDPVMAKTLVDAYIQAMQDISKRLTTAQSHRIHLALQKTLDHKQGLLNQEQDQLVALQTRMSGKLPLGSASATAYADLDSQRRAAQLELDETRARIAALTQTARKTYGNSFALPSSVPFAQDTLQRLRKAEADFASVSAIYGPDYPGYQEAKQRVEQARSQAKAEMGRQISAVQQGITPDLASLYTQQKGLQARLGGLNSATATLKGDIVSLPAAQMQVQRLTVDVARDEKLVEDLAAATTQAGIAEERDVPTFQTVDPAGVSDKPSSPRVGYATALATVAGFLLAFAWQMARAVLRQPATATELRRWTDRYGLTEEEEQYNLLAGEAVASLADRAAPQLPLADETALSRAEDRERTGTVVHE